MRVDRDRLLDAIRRYGPDSPSLPSEFDRALADLLTRHDAALRSKIVELAGFDSFGNIELADVLALLDSKGEA